ncbi:MAG: hypothetical protein ACE5OZ_05825 [Candidatus Heimdallarchaeota archaeon]
MCYIAGKGVISRKQCDIPGVLSFFGNVVENSDDSVEASIIMRYLIDVMGIFDDLEASKGVKGVRQDYSIAARSIIRLAARAGADGVTEAYDFDNLCHLMNVSDDGSILITKSNFREKSPSELILDALTELENDLVMFLWQEIGRIVTTPGYKGAGQGLRLTVGNRELCRWAGLLDPLGITNSDLEKLFAEISGLKGLSGVRIRYQWYWYRILRFLEVSKKKGITEIIINASNNSGKIRVYRIDLLCLDDIQNIQRLSSAVDYMGGWTSRQAWKGWNHPAFVKFDLQHLASRYLWTSGRYTLLPTNSLQRARLLLAQMWEAMGHEMPDSHGTSYGNLKSKGKNTELSLLPLDKIAELHQIMVQKRLEQVERYVASADVCLGDAIDVYSNALENGVIIRINALSRMDDTKKMGSNQLFWSDLSEFNFKLDVEEEAISLIEIMRRGILSGNEIQNLGNFFTNLGLSLKARKKAIKRAFAIPHTGLERVVRGGAKSEHVASEFAEIMVRNGALDLVKGEMGSAAQKLKKLYEENRLGGCSCKIDDTRSLGHLSLSRDDAGVYIIDNILCFSKKGSEERIYVLVQDKIFSESFDLTGKRQITQENVRLKKDIVSMKEWVDGNPEKFVNHLLEKYGGGIHPPLHFNLDKREIIRRLKLIKKDFREMRVVDRLCVQRMMDVAMDGEELREFSLHLEVFQSTDGTVKQVIEKLATAGPEHFELSITMRNIIKKWQRVGKEDSVSKILQKSIWIKDRWGNLRSTSKIWSDFKKGLSKIDEDFPYDIFLHHGTGKEFEFLEYMDHLGFEMHIRQNLTT